MKERGPVTDTVHQMSTGAVKSDKMAPMGSFKGAGANVVETKQPNGGPNMAGKKKKGRKY